MPRLSKHEISGIIGMVQAGLRVTDIAKYYNCHPSTIQASEIAGRLLGQ